MDLIEQLEFGIATIANRAAVRLEHRRKNGLLIILPFGLSGRGNDPLGNASQNLEVHVHPIAVNSRSRVLPMAFAGQPRHGTDTYGGFENTAIDGG
jgi:hypothetical protein